VDAHVLKLQIDHEEVSDVLCRAGVPPPRRAAFACHWSSYTRPGLMEFYARLMRDRDGTALARLQAALPERADPRWSRLRRAKSERPLGRNWGRA